MFDTLEAATDTRPSGWHALELDLATTQPDTMTDREIVDSVIEYERIVSWAQARQARLLAEFAARRPRETMESVQADRPSELEPYAADEIGLALTLSRGTAMLRIEQARELVTRLPDTLQAWEDGEIDAPKVRAICDATCFLSPEHASAVEARVLPKAAGITVRSVREALKRAVIAVDPEGVAARHAAAKKERRVCVGEEAEGMASFWALLPAPAAAASYEWLSRLARSLGAEDPRTMDQRRADLMVALLTGSLIVTPETGTETITRPPAAPGKPLVHIVMPYSTLVGADDQPCEMSGYGPIPADLARTIAADGVWKRLVTDPLSGALLDHGRTTYRPPDALADYVRARDQHCRSPICGQRALNCELDHTIAWTEGGVTADHNLWTACPHDHHLKHDAPGWTVTQHADGRIEWITPTGHTYSSHAHGYAA